MTRPKAKHDPFVPKPLTARALMEDLDALYAEIQRRERAEDLAALQASRRAKRQGKRAGIAPRP